MYDSSKTRVWLFNLREDVNTRSTVVYRAIRFLKNARVFLFTLRNTKNQNFITQDVLDCRRRRTISTRCAGDLLLILPPHSRQQVGAHFLSTPLHASHRGHTTLRWWRARSGDGYRDNFYSSRPTALSLRAAGMRRWNPFRLSLVSGEIVSRGGGGHNFLRPYGYFFYWPPVDYSQSIINTHDNNSIRFRIPIRF